MKVNNIIIGAGRSGSTTLVSYLKQSNQINFSTIKEVPYFSINEKYNQGEEFLDSWFKKENTPIKATADTYLLMSKIAPKRILQYNPNIKIAVILREPTSRAFSKFQYAINKGYIPQNSSLLEIAQQETKIIQTSNLKDQNNLAPLYSSLYHKHLQQWFHTFPKQQIFICTTSELKNNPQELINKYCHFLKIEPFTIEHLGTKNKAATFKHKWLHQILNNNNHPLRKFLKKPLQNNTTKQLIIKSGLIELAAKLNKKEANNASITEEEMAFCKEYFKKDLELLKRDYNITF